VVDSCAVTSSKMFHPTLLPGVTNCINLQICLKLAFNTWLWRNFSCICAYV
jgi:hypothetical protein